MQRPPAVNAALLQSVQCFLTESRVVPAHLLHKQFGLFAHCGAISRAAAFDDGQPGMVDMVNNRYIASFLGITPVTLSRLRHGVATKVGREKRTDEE